MLLHMTSREQMTYSTSLLLPNRSIKGHTAAHPKCLTLTLECAAPAQTICLSAANLPHPVDEQL